MIILSMTIGHTYSGDFNVTIFITINHYKYNHMIVISMTIDYYYNLPIIIVTYNEDNFL